MPVARCGKALPFRSREAALSRSRGSQIRGVSARDFRGVEIANRETPRRVETDGADRHLSVTGQRPRLIDPLYAFKQRSPRGFPETRSSGLTPPIEPRSTAQERRFDDPTLHAPRIFSPRPRSTANRETEPPVGSAAIPGRDEIDRAFVIRCHPDQSDRRGGSKPRERTMGTRRRKVDASARHPPRRKPFFFSHSRGGVSPHTVPLVDSESFKLRLKAAGALFEKLVDFARGHRPPRAAPDPPMEPLVLGKRSRAPEARKAPAADRRCAHGEAHNGYLCKECPGKGICEHGKNRSICGACGGARAAPEARKAPAPAAENRRCAHGKAHNGYYCKECPGKGICEHGNNRSICGACGRARAPEARKAPAAPAPAAGDRRCAHGRANGGYLCRECPGKGICAHGRQRHHCKECGGSQICEHGRERSKCKECRASQICKHGRQCRCKACKGARTGPGEAVRPKVIVRSPNDVALDRNRCWHGFTRQTCCACAPREFRR